MALAAEKVTLKTINKYALGDSAYYNPLTLIKDPYSGKFYSDIAPNKLLEKIDETKKFLAAYKPSILGGNGGSILDNTVSFQGDGAASFLKNFEEMTKGISPDNIVYQEKMNQSYDKHGAAWDAYFEGSYKNPRLAEDQNSKVDFKGQSNGLSIADPARKTVATVGTGLASSGTINPFGQLDSGLNI
jgi:hypothetical protein